MNYLAHIFLARQSEAAMLGALLGDFVKADPGGKYGDEVATEILIHRRVDSFTDSHPVVREARQYFDESRRRYAGILLDVFYDHLLAQNWPVYCELPLDDFIRRFYVGLSAQAHLLPDNLSDAAPRMIAQDWLGSYRDFSGVEIAINRISGRLSKNGHLLRDGLIDLCAHHASIAAGFAEFFPELIQFVAATRAEIKSSASPATERA